MQAQKAVNLQQTFSLQGHQNLEKEFISDGTNLAAEPPYLEEMYYFEVCDTHQAFGRGAEENHRPEHTQALNPSL